MFEQLLEDFLKVRTNSRKANEVVKKMLTYAKDNNDELLLGRAYYYKAETSYCNGNLDETIQYCNKSLRILHKLAPSIETVKSYNMIGIINNIRGNVVAAVESYLSAIRYSEENEMYDLMGLIYNNFATSYIDLRDYKMAIKLLKKALKYSASSKNSMDRRKYYVYTNLCYCYNAMDDINAFIKIYSLLDKIDETKLNIIDDKYQKSNIKILMLLKMGQKEEAKKQLNLFLDSMNEKLIIINITDLLAAVPYWLDSDFIKETEQFLHLCENILPGFKVKNLERLYYYHLIRLHEKKGDQKRKDEMIIKYYEASEESRKNLQKNNIDNVRDKVDLFEMEKLMRKSEVNAMTDTLTQLYNRRAFGTIFHNKFTLASKNNMPIGMAFIDVDYFKQYNDTFGHMSGDACLKTIADEIKKNCNNDTIALRYGGDEFLILFYNQDQTHICNILTNINNGIITKNIPNPNSPNHIITVTFGVYCNSDQTEQEDIYDYVIKSDRALYKGKEIKNCISLL